MKKITINHETITTLYDKAVDNECTDDFFEIVAKYRIPEDDGESETTMLLELSKLPNVDELIKELQTKI